MFNYGVCVVLQSNSAKVIYAVSQFIPVVIFNYLFRHRLHARSVIYVNFLVLRSFPAVFQFLPGVSGGFMLYSVADNSCVAAQLVVNLPVVIVEVFQELCLWM